MEAKNKTKQRGGKKTRQKQKQKQQSPLQSATQLSEYLPNIQGHIRFSLPRTALRGLLLHVKK